MPCHENLNEYIFAIGLNEKATRFESTQNGNSQSFDVDAKKHPNWLKRSQNAYPVTLNPMDQPEELDLRLC